MIAPFIVVGYVGRAAAMIVLGRDLAPFTPSRFLTDAVAGLSLFAGVCFWEMRSILGVTRKQVVTVIVLGFAFNVGVYKQTFEREIPDARRAAYEWIKKNTDANAILMDCDFRASYLSGRVSCEFPLPTSEYSALTRNGEMIRALRHHKMSPRDTGRQVLFVTDQEDLRGGKVLWSHPSGAKVVELFRPFRGR